MNDKNLKNLLGKLIKKEWSIEIYENEKVLLLNDDFRERYPFLPTDFKEFLCHVKNAQSSDSECWFICEDDYNSPNIPDSFNWNFCEMLSIEGAAKDKIWVNEIKEFWNQHLPIMFSIKNGYSYFSIGVAPNNFGKIFHGYEPLFEEPTIVCDSFQEFIKKFVSELFLDEVEYPFTDFV